MADSPALSAPETPKVSDKKGFLSGMEPWMIAAAVGLGAGVLIGLKVSRMVRPQLPARQPCPECEQRHRHAVSPTFPQRTAPSPRQPVVAPTHQAAPPVVADPTRPFSAQSLPVEEVAPGDSSIPSETFDHENLPDD